METVKQWESSEQTWWERRYAAEPIGQQRQIISSLDIPRGLRSYRRAPMLRIALQHLQNLPINQRIWIDIGAGRSQTIGSILHPQVYNYTYIATDISYSGLEHGRRNANSLPVLHASSAVPFEPQSAAVVSGLGVLHHFPDPKQTLRDMLDLLAPGGIIVLHEVRNKPRIGNRSESLTAAKDSPHEGHVEESDLRAIIAESCDRLYSTLSMTPFLVALNLGLKLDKHCEHSYAMTRFAVMLDDIFAQTISTMHASLEPWEISLVTRKR